jgi:signal transduction histidine kinase
MILTDAETTPSDLARENLRLRGDLLTIASRVSHDLRTPLCGITTACEMLKEVLAENTPEDTPYLAPILGSADEVSKLLERVSFVLKASANPPAKTQVPMGKPLAAALQRLEGRMLKRHATVTEPASWPDVEGVARWLETIWWNLIANAVQHGSDTPKIELGWREGAGEFRFWVCDNGAGVSEEDRARLFQPFHTLHEPDSTRGLGLSIVQRLVELQGGTCGYEQSKQDGACFYFTLPAGANTGEPN